MSFIADTQTKVDTVAQKIRPFNGSAADRLFRLSMAVGRAPNSMAEAWAANDIHRMIDAHVIAEQIRARDIPNFGLRLLEWFRNLLIFLPILVTWLGINQAVSSYTLYINSILNNPHADRTLLQVPFLYLWQQGFGGYLNDWFTLSKLAAYDVILLALLVVLTAIVNARTHLRSFSKEQEAELLQEELTDALTDAALCLTASPVMLQGTASGVDATRQLMELMEKERLHRDQELIALKTYTDGLVQIGQDMASGGGYIRQSVDNLKQVLDQLSGPVQQIVVDHQQILTTLGQLLHEQNDTNQSMKQLVANQNAWSQELDKALRELITSTQGLINMPAAVMQWTNQLTNLIGQLGVEHQAQATITQQTADVALRLQDALNQVQKAANELGGMSLNLFDILNTQREFPNAVRASLGEVIRDYNGAASSVAQSGATLQNAAMMLMQVASRLNGGGNQQPSGPMGPVHR